MNATGEGEWGHRQQPRPGLVEAAHPYSIPGGAAKYLAMEFWEVEVDASPAAAERASDKVFLREGCAAVPGNEGKIRIIKAC